MEEDLEAFTNRGCWSAKQWYKAGLEEIQCFYASPTSSPLIYKATDRINALDSIANRVDSPFERDNSPLEASTQEALSGHEEALPQSEDVDITQHSDEFASLMHEIEQDSTRLYAIRSQAVEGDDATLEFALNEDIATSRSSNSDYQMRHVTASEGSQSSHVPCQPPQSTSHSLQYTTKTQAPDAMGAMADNTGEQAPASAATGAHSRAGHASSLTDGHDDPAVQPLQQESFLQTVLVPTATEKDTVLNLPAIRGDEQVVISLIDRTGITSRLDNAIACSDDDKARIESLSRTILHAPLDHEVPAEMVLPSSTVSHDECSSPEQDFQTPQATPQPASVAGSGDNIRTPKISAATISPRFDTAIGTNTGPLQSDIEHTSLLPSNGNQALSSESASEAEAETATDPHNGTTSEIPPSADSEPLATHEDDALTHNSTLGQRSAAVTGAGPVGAMDRAMQNPALSQAANSNKPVSKVIILQDESGSISEVGVIEENVTEPPHDTATETDARPQNGHNSPDKVANIEEDGHSLKDAEPVPAETHSADSVSSTQVISDAGAALTPVHPDATKRARDTDSPDELQGPPTKKQRGSRPTKATQDKPGGKEKVPAKPMATTSTAEAAPKKPTGRNKAVRSAAETLSNSSESTAPSTAPKKTPKDPVGTERGASAAEEQYESSKATKNRIKATPTAVPEAQANPSSKVKAESKARGRISSEVEKLFGGAPSSKISPKGKTRTQTKEKAKAQPSGAAAAKARHRDK